MPLEDSFVADKIIDLELSDKIRAYRTNKNFSQKEVALSIGIDQAQYSRIESGKVEPTLPSLRKIAEALGVTVGDFFSDDKPLDVNSVDSDLVERLKLLSELAPDEQKSICHILDIAIHKKRLKDSLQEVLRG